MKEYNIKWKKSAVKELNCLPKEIAIIILQSVDISPDTVYILSEIISPLRNSK